MQKPEYRPPAEPSALVRILKKIPFFSGLLDWEYEALLSICRVTTHIAGTTLFHAGEPGQHMYIVLSGQVEIRTPKGMVNCAIGPGEVIGEVAIVMSLPRRSANAVVSKESALLAISRADIDALLAKAPRVSYLIMRNVAEVLAERLVANNRRLDAM